MREWLLTSALSQSLLLQCSGYASSAVVTLVSQAHSTEQIPRYANGREGGPTAAVMAYRNPNITVTVVDMNEERTRRWQSKHLPIHEPSLNDIVRIARDGTEARVEVDGTTSPARQPNLFFSIDCSRHIAMADIVFLSVNTPTKSNGLGAGFATDISMFESAARSVALVAKPGAIIVEKSTVPCRTADMVYDIVSVQPFSIPKILSDI
jgi:UDPglucose 6-dehydrogenase